MHSEYARTRRAAEAMAARMGFYIHAAVFATVVIGLALLNVLTAPDELWVQWVALGWGAGVALHACLCSGGGRVGSSHGSCVGSTACARRCERAAAAVPGTPRPDRRFALRSSASISQAKGLGK